MKKLVYSPNYTEKMREIKKYLEMQFGAAVRKKVIREIGTRVRSLREYEDSLLCPTALIFILRGVRSLIPGTFTNKTLANLEIVSQDSPFFIAIVVFSGFVRCIKMIFLALELRTD